jgi:hypothetical protein
MDNGAEDNNSGREAVSTKWNPPENNDILISYSPASGIYIVMLGKTMH